MKCTVPLDWKDIEQCLHHKMTIDNTNFYNNNNKPSEPVLKNKEHSKQNWHSATPQWTFSDTTTGFPAKWRLRNKCRNSILMKRPYQILVVLLIGWSKFPRWHENVGSYLWASATIKRFWINSGFREMPTNPSPRLTSTDTSHLGQNKDGLGEG